MRLYSVLMAVVAIGLMGESAYAQTKTITALDLAIDWKGLVGQTLMIAGCTIAAADLTSANCAIDSPTGSVGNISIDSASMDRTSLRAALENCAAFDEVPNCRADVVATVKNEFGDPELVGAVLTWK